MLDADRENLNVEHLTCLWHKLSDPYITLWKVGNQLKLTTKSSDLCSGLPIEYQLYIDYVRKLAFEERPNYELLRGMF